MGCGGQNRAGGLLLPLTAQSTGQRTVLANSIRAMLPPDCPLAFSAGESQKAAQIPLLLTPSIDNLFDRGFIS